VEFVFWSFTQRKNKKNKIKEEIILKKLNLIMISILVMACFAGVISVSYATEEVKIGCRAGK